MAGSRLGNSPMLLHENTFPLSTRNEELFAAASRRGTVPLRRLLVRSRVRGNFVQFSIIARFPEILLFFMFNVCKFKAFGRVPEMWLLARSTDFIVAEMLSGRVPNSPLLLAWSVVMLGSFQMQSGRSPNDSGVDLKPLNNG